MDARNPTIQLERSNTDVAQRQSLLATLSWSQIAKLVRTEADGLADPNELEQLASDPIRWRNVLTDMIEDLEDRMHSIRRLKGPQRKQVIIDFEGEFTLLTDAYERATGEPYSLDDDTDPSPSIPVDAVPEPAALQLSWTAGRVIAWAAGAFTEGEAPEQILERLVAAGAPETAWEDYRRIELPTGFTAPALCAQVGDVLGWLAALSTQLGGRRRQDSRELVASTQTDDDTHDVENSEAVPEEAGNRANIQQIGASARWLSLVAATAVGLVAQGRTVPKLQRIRKRRNKRNRNNKGEFIVQWMPGIINKDRLEAFATSLPGAVTAADPGPDARAVVQSALTGMINAIVTSAASRLDVPAPPPDPKTKTEIAETFLANLGGKPFSAAADHGSDPPSLSNGPVP